MDHHQQKLNMSHQSSKLWWKVLSVGWDAQERLLRRDAVEAERRVRVQNVLPSHQEEGNSSGILQMWGEKGDSSLWLQGPHCAPRKQAGGGASSSCSGSLSRWVVLGQEPSPQLWASALSHPAAVHLHNTAQPWRSSLAPGMARLWAKWARWEERSLGFWVWLGMKFNLCHNQLSPL